MRSHYRALLPLAFLLSYAASCPPKPPIPPGPLPIKTCGLTLHICEKTCDGMEVGKAHKIPGAVAVVAGRTAIADGAGNVTTLGTFDASSQPYLVSVTAEGFYPVKDEPVMLCEVTSKRVPMQPIPPPPDPKLPSLVPSGNFFRLSTGEAYQAIGASDFALLARYQRGENVEPIIKQRVGAGINILRVWTRYQGWSIGGDSYTDIDYTKVAPFLTLAAKNGVHVELTAFSGTKLNWTDETTTWPDDPSHWTNLCAAVQGQTNVLLELVNERDQPANKLTHEYAPCAGILSSHGSNGSEVWPVAPYWGYTDFHTNGASEEQRKASHNAWEIWSGTTFTNEMSRYPDVGMWRGRTLEEQKKLAYGTGQGCGLLNAGCTFHSVHGKTSELWDADELAVAKELARGIRSIPVTCQPGAYRHREDLEGLLWLRVYQRGYVEECIAYIPK